MTAGLGTPTNRAWRAGGDRRQGAAGAGHDRRPDLQRHASRAPGSSASCRSTRTRARRSASCWPRRPASTRSRSCRQNDDYGKGYVEGFKSRDQGQDNIQVVKELTYEATDTSVDAQLTELAAQRRRRLLQRDVDHPADDLVAAEGAAARLEAQLVPALEHVEPGRRSSSPAAPRRSPASTRSSFSKAPASPAFAADEDVHDVPRRPSSSTATTRTPRRSRTASGAGWSARRSSRPSRR